MTTPKSSDAILDRLLTLHPKIIDLTLGRMWRILGALGDPQDHLPPVIHVAGTNGKGSTVAMIRAGLEAAGHRVHVYTSPHLVRFHERVRLAGDLIDEDHLSALLEECETANGGVPITFFEITTAAAMLAFARTPADYTLVEVGLGGRLDATNVFPSPALTVITPVSIDHQQYLGETLAEIAGEKAGILKRGVPGIIAPQDDTARDVIEDRALAIGAPLSMAGQDWQVTLERDRVVFQDDRALLDLDPPALRGAHQIDNAGTAIAALRALGQDDAVVQAALTHANWPGRMQRIEKGVFFEQLPKGSELWVDGGHNAAAGQALADLLAPWAPGPKPVHLLVGMLETKAAEDYLRPMAPHVTQAHAVTIPNTNAAIAADDLAARAKSVGLAARPSPAIAEVVEDLANQAHPVRLVVCGSLYLAGAFLAENGSRPV
ncbi:MAG: folylpolyglutamate synthase/dihydrofolate synthase family protein [Pseudomonadota bacterium]